jgi:hypothetical protein
VAQAYTPQIRSLAPLDHRRDYSYLAHRDCHVDDHLCGLGNPADHRIIRRRSGPVLWDYRIASSSTSARLWGTGHQRHRGGLCDKTVPAVFSLPARRYDPGRGTGTASLGLCGHLVRFGILGYASDGDHPSTVSRDVDMYGPTASAEPDPLQRGSYGIDSFYPTFGGLVVLAIHLHCGHNIPDHDRLGPYN